MVWHTSQELRLRQTPVPSRANDDDENDVEGDVQIDAETPSNDTDSDDGLENSPGAPRRARLE